MSETLRLGQFLPYRCNNLGERISVALSRIYVEQFGISISEWRILATLAEHGQLQARQIGRLTHMDKVRVSRALSSLHSHSLLERRKCEQDKRAVNITLNQAGRRLYNQIVPKALAWERRLLQTLSRDEKRTLFAILDKLDASLDRLTNEADA